MDANRMDFYIPRRLSSIQHWLASVINQCNVIYLISINHKLELSYCRGLSATRSDWVRAPKLHFTKLFTVLSMMSVLNGRPRHGSHHKTPKVSGLIKKKWNMCVYKRAKYPQNCLPSESKYVKLSVLLSTAEHEKSVQQRTLFQTSQNFPQSLQSMQWRVNVYPPHLYQAVHSSVTNTSSINGWSSNETGRLTIDQHINWRIQLWLVKHLNMFL